VSWRALICVLIEPWSAMSTRPAEEQPSPGTPSILKVVVSSLVGTTIEWYDFFLYGSAAALVFNKLFFPSFDPLVGTLLAFATYAGGFLARPLGGLVFGHFGDKVGRKRMLVLSLIIMGIATFAIGLLPTYSAIGVLAPILLVILRLLQGFAVGGEWGGAVLIVAEHGSAGRRGFWSSWPQAGVPAGNLLAVGVLFLLASTMGDAVFEAGWRVLFLAERPARSLIGLYIRVSISESPAFEREQAEMKRSRVRQAGPHSPGACAATAARSSSRWAPASSRTSRTRHLHCLRVGVCDHRAGNGKRARTQRRPLIAQPSSWLRSRCSAHCPTGRPATASSGAAGVGVWGFAFFALADTSRSAATALAVTVGLVLHAMMYGPQAVFFAELFGTSVRYSGASIGYQLASVFAGSLAPDHRGRPVGEVRLHHAHLDLSGWLASSRSSRCCCPAKPDSGVP
jgi:MFS family permease